MKKHHTKRDTSGKKDGASVQVAGADAFAQAMTDVVRLPPDPRRRVRAAPSVSARQVATPPSSPASGDAIDQESETSFVAPGVDRRELRKLKRGHYVPGRRLDLHGQTAAKVAAAVQRFIDATRHRHRCVCIIHGRGLHSEGGVSVVKTHVRTYLRRHHAVLAYNDAPAADGGAGAVYVLLRNGRSGAHLSGRLVT